jgi:nitrile hydratase
MQNGPHDVGGVRGFGAVDPSPDDAAYPEGWEGACIAGIIAAIGAGAFNVDEFRARIEELPPAAYWSMGYYRRWFHTLERNLVLHGTLTEREIAARVEELSGGGAEPPRRDDPELFAAIDELLDHGAPLHREVPKPPLFAAGDRVRTKRLEVNRPGEEHTRLPGYAQGRSGVVERQYPAMTLPDANVRHEDVAEYVYAVSFAASDLWPDGDSRTRVSADLFESYMEPEEG